MDITKTRLKYDLSGLEIIKENLKNFEDIMSGLKKPSGFEDIGEYYVVAASCRDRSGKKYELITDWKGEGLFVMRRGHVIAIFNPQYNTPYIREWSETKIRKKLRLWWELDRIEEENIAEKVKKSKEMKDA